jgi:hypothetical protein
MVRGRPFQAAAAVGITGRVAPGAKSTDARRHGGRVGGEVADDAWGCAGGARPARDGAGTACQMRRRARGKSPDRWRRAKRRRAKRRRKWPRRAAERSASAPPLLRTTRTSSCAGSCRRLRTREPPADPRSSAPFVGYAGRCWTCGHCGNCGHGGACRSPDATGPSQGVMLDRLRALRKREARARAQGGNGKACRARRPATERGPRVRPNDDLTRPAPACRTGPRAPSHAGRAARTQTAPPLFLNAAAQRPSARGAWLAPSGVVGPQ